ncbi:MAG: hypothetical protein JO161_09765 [Planctomycetaceae bacterium]|nr:hypothetical protein [Planctomycetaceae bacterium]
MNRERWWLALTYVLTTVLVQGMHHHDHGWSDKSAVTWCDPGYSNLCPHMAGRPSPDLGHAPNHCLACQYRAEPHSCVLAPPSLEELSVSVAAVSFPALAPSRTFLQISCRSPPLA